MSGGATGMKTYFNGGTAGEWAVKRITTICGTGLATATHLSVEDDETPAPHAWTLIGVRSNQRYTTRNEAGALLARQAPLGRPEAACAALIPIRKTPLWWELAQDERRAVFEERSRHTSIGMEYLPQVARRLYHCRDLGGPFDFLTWFEFAPEHEVAFDDMLVRLRASEEWTYVDREVDIRLVRTL